MALKDVSAMSQRSGFVVLSRREESGVANRRQLRAYPRTSTNFRSLRKFSDRL